MWFQGGCTWWLQGVRGGCRVQVVIVGSSLSISPLSPLYLPYISRTGSSLSIVLSPTHCIEVLLRDGRRLTFGNLLDREGTIRLLRAARTQAQHQHTPGP